MKNIYLYLLLILVLAGCSVNRQMQKVSEVTREETKSHETVQSSSEAVTNTDLSVLTTTKITEIIDTLVPVIVAPTGDARLDEFLKNNPLQVPVRVYRTTERQEAAKKSEQKKENTQTDQNKTTILQKETDKSAKAVDIHSRNYLPLILIGGGIILAVLLFVFLWKRIPLTGILAKYKRKSPG